MVKSEFHFLPHRGAKIASECTWLFGEILSICSQDMEPKRSFGKNEVYNSVTNVQKKKGNTPNLDIVNINA